MKRQLCSIALCALLCLAGATSAEVTIGGPAPDIAVEKLLRGPDDAEATWAGLEGKAVVLEFWATWCGPCIEAIPHLNGLVANMEGENIVFISITSEDEATVKEFLKERFIESWIALDTDKSAFTDYGVHSIPHTVLIMPDRKVAAITNPTRVKEEHLRDLIAGRPLPELNSSVATATNDDGASREHPGQIFAGREFPADNEPMYALLLRKTQYPGMRSDVRSGEKITALGQPLPSLVQYSYSTPGTRIIYELDYDPDQQYDFIVNLPASPGEAALRPAQEALEQAFGFTARREMREVDVYVLKQGDSLGPDIKKVTSEGGMSASGSANRLSVVNATVNLLVLNLEYRVQRPIVDESGLEGTYDVTLTFQEAGPAVVNAIKEQLGLELVPARRELEVLVIAPADATPPTATQ